MLGVCFVQQLVDVVNWAIVKLELQLLKVLLDGAKVLLLRFLELAPLDVSMVADIIFEFH